MRSPRLSYFLCHIALLCLLIIMDAVVSPQSSSAIDGGGYVQMEVMRQSAMNGFVKNRAIDDPENVIIELDFRIRQKNLDALKSIVDSISDPHSQNYGKHLTKQELDSLTHNSAGKQIILEFLESIGAHVIKQTGSSIAASAAVSTWNTALHADFAEYSCTLPENASHNVIRTPVYSLPEAVGKEVTTVLSTVQFPAQIHGGPKRAPEKT